MVLYLVIGICAIAIGLWNLLIAVLGSFPQCQADAIGTLCKSKTKRNVKSGRSVFGSVPILTEYTYTYCVSGKTYRYLGSAQRSKGHLLPKVSMVYVKWFPRHAYPNKFSGTKEWAFAFVFLLIGILAATAALLPFFPMLTYNISTRLNLM